MDKPYDNSFGIKTNKQIKIKKVIGKLKREYILFLGVKMKYFEGGLEAWGQDAANAEGRGVITVEADTCP